MADISMCANAKCTRRKNCYRATARASTYQSYSDFKQDEWGDCPNQLDPKTRQPMRNKK